MSDHASTQRFEGACHCGAIGFAYRPTQPPRSWQVRACQCRFCLTHGAETTSDPDGAVAFVIQDDAQLHKYRFGSRSADFYVCRACGVYIAAVITSPQGRFATINVNALRDRFDAPRGSPVSYEGESPQDKVARRERRWTPVVERL